MVEKETVREKETQFAQTRYYDAKVKDGDEENERRRKARKLIKGKEIPWESSRQAFLRWYCNEYMDDIANNLWNIFVQDIRVHSGKHVHMGGANIFILRGRGYTVVNGVRYDWSEGDLICLPLTIGGVEHQHFNLDNKPSRWVALINQIKSNALGHYIKQKENRAGWKE